MLNEEEYNKEKTLKWIENLNKDRIFGIKSVFYRLNILKLFNKKLEIPKEYASKLSNKIAFTNLENAFLSTAILKLSGYDDLHNIAKWVLSFQNEDGGFGLDKSDISSTCYALESLNLIDPSLIGHKNKIIEFTESCKTDGGVFAYTPISYPPYIEGIHAGIIIHEIIGQKVKNPLKIVEFVRNLQNIDGGFRRSPHMGISELDYTFRALYVLKSLSY